MYRCLFCRAKIVHFFQKIFTHKLQRILFPNERKFHNERKPAGSSGTERNNIKKLFTFYLPGDI